MKGEEEVGGVVGVVEGRGWMMSQQGGGGSVGGGAVVGEGGDNKK